MEDRLEEIRKEIDEVDRKLLSLLEERILLSAQLSPLKEAAGLPLTDLKREEQVYDQLRKETENALLAAELPSLFGPIMELAKAAQLLKQGSGIPYRSVGIVGMGLMGSSLAQAIRWVAPTCYLIGVDPHAYKGAPPCSLDGWRDSVEGLSSEVECILLASPIERVIPLADKMVKEATRKGTSLFLADIASVKGEIAHAFAEYSEEEGIFCLPTHPMAGRPKAGPTLATPTLFAGAAWGIILSEGQQAPSSFLTLVERLGAHPLCCTAEEHDRWVALVSHLPAYLARRYKEFVEAEAPDALALAGPGYAALMRLANRHPALQQAIERANHSLIQGGLEGFLRSL